jgi:limonene-1,2-epoxide hydrolase
MHEPHRAGGPTGEPRAVTAAFWDALYARDWPRIRSFFGPASIYYDVPTGPTTAARGADGIEARLRLGLAGLAGYEHGPARVVAEGGVVVTEHTEIWHWDSGEVATLPFVSVQHVQGPTITLWKDYWDLGTLMAQAPPGWQDRLAEADLSWMVDVTAEVRESSTR